MQVFYEFTDALCLKAHFWFYVSHIYTYVRKCLNMCRFMLYTFIFNSICKCTQPHCPCSGSSSVNLRYHLVMCRLRLKGNGAGVKNSARTTGKKCGAKAEYQLRLNCHRSRNKIILKVWWNRTKLDNVWCFWLGIFHHEFVLKWCTVVHKESLGSVSLSQIRYSSN